MKQIIYLGVLLVCLSNNMSAQIIRQVSTNTNMWLMYVGTHKIADKWSLHLEAQLRRNDVLANAQQILLRGGINYHINPQMAATVGYCFVETYPYGELPAKSRFPENRLWEQIQFKHQVGNLEWISRFRLEQRFVNLPVANGTTFEANDTATYTNRFRLLNRFSIPFKGKTIVDKSIYLSFYDELMVNFGKKVALNLFDQNRVYIAIGYKIPKVGRLEIGYLNQQIVKSDGKTIENNHTLQVGLSANIDFYKKKQ